MALNGKIKQSQALTGSLVKSSGSGGDPNPVITRGTGANSILSVNTSEPNVASADSSIAIGVGNQATAKGAMAIGALNLATGQNAIAIGNKIQNKPANQATNLGSIAIGSSTQATGLYAVSVGNQTIASGGAAFAAGNFTEASGTFGVATGYATEAEARYSAAFGNSTDATGGASFVIGAFNEPDENAVDATHGQESRKYIFIVGNGTDNSNRSNAMTLDWDGNTVVAGKMTVGAAPTADMDVATKKYVDDNAGGGGGGGLSQEAKAALMDCFAHTAWTDANGQTYYNALAAALGLRVLTSITAVFTQGSATIYDTDSLDTLKQYLTVTATYSDSTTAVVTDYTLSGTLEVGTSTITVSYGGKTDTFDVTVTLNRETIFGTFHNGWAIGKKTSSSQGGSMPMYACWNNSTSARASMTAPILNNGYTFTVTNSSLYNVAVYGFADNTEYATTYSGAVNGKYFQGDTVAPSFAASGSTNANYVMIALKRMSGSFTEAELANGAEAVFTYTTT